jgi:HEAT repeat protein
MKFPLILPLIAPLVLLGACKREEADPSSSSGRSSSRSSKSSISPSQRAYAKNDYIDGKWKLGAPGTEAEKAFEDADTVEAKILILEKLQASDPGSLASVLRRALRSPDESLRIQAVMKTSSLQSSPAEAADILTAAAADESAEVRAHAMEMTHEQATEARLEIFAATLTSTNPDVRDEALLELGRLRSKPALETLFRGLENGDPDFVTRVNQELVNLVNSQFASYEEATEWWKANSEKFDERLIRSVD